MNKVCIVIKHCSDRIISESNNMNDDYSVTICISDLVEVQIQLKLRPNKL